jgi:hypothetical protein
MLCIIDKTFADDFQRRHTRLLLQTSSTILIKLKKYLVKNIRIGITLSEII